MPSLELLTTNLESQALSKKFEARLNELGDKFFQLIALTPTDSSVKKFINAFRERDKYFYRRNLKPDKLAEGQVVFKFVSRE